MGETFDIPKQELRVLREFHRACQDKKTAYRINAVILLASGWSYSQVEDVLLLDERTLRRYKNLYLEKGIDGLVENNYQGGYYKLSSWQILILKEELRENLYSSAKEVCHFVRKRFGIRYTAKGMVQTLHRLGFSYKKTKTVPRKSDRSKQEAFVVEYEERYKSLPENEKVIFIDGTHPTFNNQIGYGWIATGENYFVKTHEGRKRLNLLGAYSPESGEILVRDYARLNQEATCDFLAELRRRYPRKKLHVFLDNVKYHHSKKVVDFASKNNINLAYLPTYSPNLNLIERFWGLMKKDVLTNRYYENFSEFRKAILRYCHQKNERFRHRVKSYIPEKFHLLPHAW